jgi:hypothetical protein
MEAEVAQQRDRTDGLEREERSRRPGLEVDPRMQLPPGRRDALLRPAPSEPVMSNST